LHGESAICNGSDVRALKISAISFLNTAPLMWDFEHEPAPEIRENFEVEYTVPSLCAEALRMGEADIGIIPVITTAEIAGLVVLPDVAIAARNKVRSILLVSRRPMEEIRTVAVDTSSRTSVGLTQVLLTKFFGGRRQLKPMAPVLGPMLAECDAGLLIGDPAMMVKTDGLYAHELYIYDLAEVWREKTGLPFVFAVWAVRRAALAEMREGLELGGIFRRSRDHGLRPENVAAIAREWSPRMGLEESEIVRYLQENIHYRLDAECRKGLARYFELAAECGVIERAPELEFWEGK
jgi:chorismate dehydratase